jgi:hypothetical protein
VFEGPVHTTGKKPQLNPTEPQKNQTISCGSSFSEIKTAKNRMQLSRFELVLGTPYK